MFKPVLPKLDVTEMEEKILRHWQWHDIFHKSMEIRKGGKEYIFFEGPPTANGKPGVHHVLARAFKDIFPRYKTMQGFHVLRRGRWDTQRLPVEIEVEKKLGFTGKKQSESFGIGKVNELCRESAFTYIQEWEKLTDRIGYWVDLKTAYITYKNEYIESVWWILKNFWDRDLLYQGYKVVPYCPRCGTPLSDHEVAQGYRETSDPSVFVRMPLVDEPGTSLLVWTTTPWTLPANVAVAVGAEVDYVKINREMQEGGTEKLILAENLLAKLFGHESVTVLDTFKGKHLKDKKYKPLFTFLPTTKPAHYVVLGEFVTTEDGSGLVHIAPAFGADDMQMAIDSDLPILSTVAEDGTFISDVQPWAGKFVKDADPYIVRDLADRGLLFKKEEYVHTYPFCWRCDTPLLYYARPTWYIRTSQFKDRMVELNNQINWYPGHIRNGRFGNWLSNNIDWALGRERYWGTPLPVWECESCHTQVCIGSVKELSEKAGYNLEGSDLHRPYVDEIKFKCSECGGRMKRVPELIDVWFDSGSMPSSQWHFPFENEEQFKAHFPADYICEAVDQTRGWFYSLHAISTLLFDTNCYKNVICLGHILDADGQKMSKTKGNVVPPWEVIDKHGADALRWYLYTASPPGQERRFSSDLVGEVVRNFTLTLWNTYSFFVTYANLDGWQPEPKEVIAYSSLDKWLRSSLHALVRDVTYALETYDVLGATRPIEQFVDVLSNWYLRRSRRRFWKSGSDSDKNAAYATLYEALLTVAKLLAPTMPFIADEIYLNLEGTVDRQGPESVHLVNWLAYDAEVIDEKLNADMALVMKLTSLGHAARNKANRKVRQPLSDVAFALPNREEAKVLTQYAELLEEELNVKSVRSLNSAAEAVSYTLNPLPKQLGQKYGNKYPEIRKLVLGMDAEKAAGILLAGNSLKVTVANEDLELLPEEVEVRIQAKEGFSVASEGAYVAALVTELTAELIEEGLAREFVRRLQDLRKTANLDIADRIRVVFTATPGLANAVANFKDYIKTETLATDLTETTNMHDWIRVEDEFDGEKVCIALEKQ